MSNYRDIVCLIEKLCITSRFPGTEGSLHARDVILSHLKNVSFEYNLFYSQIPQWSIDDEPIIEFLFPEKLIVKGIPAIFSPPTPSEGIEGEVVNTNKLKMLDSFDWDRYSILGVNGNVLGFLISTSYIPHMEPLPADAQALPNVILDSKTHQKLQKWIVSEKEIYVRLKNPTKTNGSIDIISVLTKEPTSKPYPLICAHYDTVYNSSGAHDNASGVAVALQLARELSLLDIPCRFAFFDGEETNKAGSIAFVKEEKRINLLKNISFVLEIDSVGIGNEIGLLCSKKLYKKLKKFKNIFDNVISDNYKISISPQTRIAFCDVWPFMLESIPVIRMLTRGSVGQHIMHTAEDTIDKIERDTLLVAFEIAQTIIKNLREDKDGSRTQTNDFDS